MARTMTSNAVNIPRSSEHNPRPLSGSLIGSVMNNKAQQQGLGQSLTLDTILSPDMETKLMRARKMSQAMQCPMKQAQRMLMGTPTAPEDISKVWAVPVINQYLLKHNQDLIQSQSEIRLFELQPFKHSAGDFSSTFKLDLVYESPASNAAGDSGVDGPSPSPAKASHKLSFVVKLLPVGDPGRVYVFEANLMEKEIDLYFEILPAINLFISDKRGEASALSLEHLVPECVYGSHNMQGAGALVFTSCVEKGFAHNPDANGLKGETVDSIVKSIARLHACSRAFVAKHGEMGVRRRYPCLTEDMYCIQLFQQHAEKHLHTFEELLHAAPEKETVTARRVLRALKVHGVAGLCRGLRRQGPGSLNTLIHGEVWEKNILLRPDTDECLLLDWKNAKLATGTLDLAFLLFSSASLDVLENNLSSLFHTYADTFSTTLAQLDITEKPPSKADVEKDFGQSVIAALMQALCTICQEMQYVETLLQDPSCTEPELKATQLHAYEQRAINLLELPLLAELVQDQLDAFQEARESSEEILNAYSP